MTKEKFPVEYSRNLTSIQRSLYAYILSLLPNRTDAEDVLQETNLILCQKASEYDPAGHFQGWAFKIARFQVMKQITKNKRSKLHFNNEIVENLTTDDFDPERIRIIQKALQYCYEALPEHMRTVAKMRFREEMNLKEISVKIKRPLGSISATLHRIRSNLSKCVQNKMLAYKREAEY